MKKASVSILGLLVLLISSLYAVAQNNTIDSLEKVLKTQKEDTNKVNALNALANEFRYSNTDTAMQLTNEALALAGKLHHEKGIADAKLMTGALNASLGKNEEGIKAADEALVLYNKLLPQATGSYKKNILAKIGRTYTVIGHNRTSQGNYPEALKNYFISIKFREEAGDKKGVMDTEFNIGNIYTLQHNYSEALKYCSSSLKIAIELGSKPDIAGMNNAIGWVYIQQGNYAEASKYCSLALQIAEETKDKATLSEVYNTMGLLKNYEGKYTEALKYDFNALHLYEETGIYQQLPDIYNNIGLVYLKQKKYNDASEYFNKALSTAKNTGNLGLILWSYENLATLDSAQGNYIKSLEHYKLAIYYRDSMLNEENTKKTVQQQMQYEFDKQQDSAKAAQDKKDALAALEITNQKIIRNISFALAILILAFSVYAFYRYKKKKQLQNQQALMSERLRISRELHDEVGATLSGIAMYSHLTKEQIKHANFQEVEKSVTVMQQSAGEMVNKLSDIVWLVNPDQDSLQKLIQRLEEYARDMAAINNITVKVNAPENLHEHSLPMESRRNIYLFCKEAINNAVKYSNATLLELNIKETDNTLEFSVSDNGKGFDIETIKRGNGLDNMQKRANEIGAKLRIESKENAGSLVSMQVNIS